MLDWLKRHRRRLIPAAVALLLAILCGVCLGAYRSQASALSSQYAAERFRGTSETRFAQATAFFPEGKGREFKDIYLFREKIDPALTDAGVETPERGSLWTDAYSAESKLTVKSGKLSTETGVLGVGGEWFYFHPLRLRSGNYLSETEFMHDSVILDEVLAWQLFGGYELTGMQVEIGGKPYRIAGVVARESSKAEKMAMGEASGMLYMHYDALAAEFGDSAPKITSYELVCAEPISGFTLGLLTKTFEDAVSVQNTGRFAYGESLKLILHAGERSMSTVALVYPYWENAARYTGDRLAVLLAAAVILGLFPFGVAAYYVIRLIRAGWERLRWDILPDAWERFSDAVRERQRRALVKRRERREKRNAAAR